MSGSVPRVWSGWRVLAPVVVLLVATGCNGTADYREVAADDSDELTVRAIVSMAEGMDRPVLIQAEASDDLRAAIETTLGDVSYVTSQEIAELRLAGEWFPNGAVVLSPGEMRFEDRLWIVGIEVTRRTGPDRIEQHFALFKWESGDWVQVYPDDVGVFFDLIGS